MPMVKKSHTLNMKKNTLKTDLYDADFEFFMYAEVHN